MNSIGIDFGRTASTVCISEGDWRKKTGWRNVGDGKRLLIPNAVDGEGRWASAAVEANSSTLRAGFIEPEHGAWLDESTVEKYLSGLAKRIVSYLGRVEPVRRQGFEVVIAPHSLDFLSAEKAILRVCRPNFIPAFEDAFCIPPVRALLSRWAMERPSDGSKQVNAIVVHVGDTQSAVARYEVVFDEGFARVAGSGILKALPECGSFGWEQAMVKEIAQRSRSGTSAPILTEIFDAVRQVAALMRQDKPHASIRLPHQLAERMYHPMEFRRSEMVASMMEVNALTQPLAVLVEQSLQEMKAETPTEIIVGGVGAFWPFAFDSLSSLFMLRDMRFWQSTDPREDVARGAAIWPVFASVAHAPWSDLNPRIGLASGRLENQTPSQPASDLSLTDWMQRPPVD